MTSPGERQRREAALRSLMDATGAGALLIVGRADGSERGRIHYVSDLSVMGGISYVVLPRDGAAVLVQPAFVGRAWADTAGWIADTRSAVEPIAAVSRALVERLPATARLGIVGLGGVMPIGDFARLREELPGIETFDATAAFDAVRAVKSEEEIAALRATSALLLDAYAVLDAEIAPGRSEREVVAAVIGAVRRGGGLGGFLHVSRSGGTRALHPPTDEAIRPDDVLTFDLEYTGREHYALELTRQYSFGPPPPPVLERFLVQSRVFERVRDALRPGRSTLEIGRLVGEAYADEGYAAAGPEGWGPVQLHAHGIGLDFGEPPSIPGPPATLEADMVLALHPNLGPEDPSLPAIALADNVRVTAAGGERLTPGEFTWRTL